MTGCNPDIVLVEKPVQLPLPAKNKLAPIPEDRFVYFVDEANNQWICTDGKTLKDLAIREGILANDRDIYYNIIQENNTSREIP